MSDLEKNILIVVYLILSILLIIYILKCKRKNKRLKIVDFFNIYFLLVYFIVPIFSYYNQSNKFLLHYQKFIGYDIKYHLISLTLAIIFIVIFNYTYNRIGFKVKKEKEIEINSNYFFILNIFFSVVGIMAYYLWTKVYGFPFGILKYADILRDGKTVLNNPYTFMQPICSFATVSSYMWLIYVKEQGKISLRIISIIFFGITFFFSILSALATDGRMSIIVTLFVPIIYFINKKQFNVKKISIIGIIMIILLYNIDGITYMIRNGVFKKNEEKINIGIILSNEFGYVYSNRINLLYNLENSELKYTELMDLTNIIYAWIPKTRKPPELQSLGRYNTSLYTYSTGAIPTDIVTAAIYKGRFLGIICLPIFIGIIIKYLDCFFIEKKSSFYGMIYTIICISITLRLVAYYDLSEILFGQLALIIYYITIAIFCKRRKKNEINKIY